MNNLLPIVDLHCDLLFYLIKRPGATAFDADKIGAAVPHLRAGGVKLQVMALFTPTGEGSAENGMQQAIAYRELLENEVFKAWEPGFGKEELLRNDDVIYAWPSIESGSNFAEENESLDRSLARMEQLFALTGTPLYISLTHEPENRFGGGNGTKLGLKDDGKVLLETLSGRGIAIDMAHTSDAMAHDILNHIEGKGLDLRILASHSNFRPVTHHNRNLPDELAKEIIRREGLIGLNFVRDFIDSNDADKLFEHARYAIELGAGDVFAWGADFFSTFDLPAKYQDRMPIFHPEHEDASVYPALLERMKTEAPQMDLEKMCYGNFLRFLGK